MGNNISETTNGNNLWTTAAAVQLSDSNSIMANGKWQSRLLKSAVVALQQLFPVMP